MLTYVHVEQGIIYSRRMQCICAVFMQLAVVFFSEITNCIPQSSDYIIVFETPLFWRETFGLFAFTYYNMVLNLKSNLNGEVTIIQGNRPISLRKISWDCAKVTLMTR